MEGKRQMRLRSLRFPHALRRHGRRNNDRIVWFGPRKENYIMKTPTLIVALLLCGSAALAQDDPARQTAEGFVTRAATANLFEVEAGKLVLQRGKDPKAQEFAQQMVTDHQAAGSKMREVAMADGISLPQGLDDEHKKKLDALKAASDADFDQAYLSTQLTGHQQTVALFDDYAKHGPEGEVRDTAKALLPTLRMHLAHIEELTDK